MATAQWESVPPSVDAFAALKELTEILKAQQPRTEQVEELAKLLRAQDKR